MRLLGVLGGMSWESSAHLYALLNRGVATRLGGLHSAPVLMHSVDFADIEARQRAGDWVGAAALLGAAGAGLKAAGAEGLLLATNTMHRVADAIEAAAGLPLLHIVDATALALRAQGIRRAGLLATRYTMEPGSFYHLRMQRHGIELLTPAAAQADEVNRIIYEQLCRGQILPASRQLYLEAVRALAGRGAQAVILGCTEIGLLLDASAQPLSPLPFFDSTALQAQAAVDWICTPGGTTTD
ncbi:aspartate/glutamate racemase family protein [Paucibacter sediminis]|uniref:Aspartate/glutamate racemase family protein n=1 Tax=Paucibacter sediminis TaxID=3019553 RepID=A0AA95NJK0_9BURK|nr:aspartate/glutamate racemase family protein [Paucibacter sp. S2-9]WIT13799.1 aspartate/glutamate racemase family protein [Paucibacter sp. S2-9]